MHWGWGIKAWSCSLVGEVKEAAVGSDTLSTCKVEKRNGTYKCFERVCRRQTFEAVQAGQAIEGESRSTTTYLEKIAMSADGTSVAIGDPHYEDRFSEYGRVRVFRWNQSNARWVQVGQTLEGGKEKRRFGFDLALSSDGRRLAVVTHAVADHVEVFDLEGGRWVQVGEGIPNKVTHSVALSGDGSRLVFGETSNEDEGRGLVKVFELKRSGLWVQVGQDIAGEQPRDFAYGVAMSSDGNRVAIGARGHSHIRVFEIVADGTMWKQLGGDIDPKPMEYAFGTIVIMSGDGNYLGVTLTVRRGGRNVGQVQVFKLQSDRTWAQHGGALSPERPTEFYLSVGLSANGRRVAIGSPQNTVNGTRSGNMRLFEFQAASGWVQLGEDVDGTAFDLLGEAVAISADGTRVAVSAPNDKGGAESSGFGQLRMFDFVKRCE